MSEMGSDTTCALQGIFDKCQGMHGSVEHIIPNSIGGRKKAHCICAACNSESGNQWDAVLTKQFNILCIYFGVTRQRGAVRSELVRNSDGEEFLFFPSGTVQPRKPMFDESDIDGDKTKISVQAAYREQAIEIIKGIAKKKGYAYSKTEIEYTEALLDGDLDVSHNMDLAGPEVGRSVTKMIYIFSISSGLKKIDMPTAWRYLSGETQQQCFGPYYTTDPVKGRPAGVPIHVLHITGNPASKLLYGYVELLGLFRYFVLLSDQYSGEVVSLTHALDPTKGEEIEVSVELGTGEENLLSNLKPTLENMQAHERWIAENMPTYMADWLRKNKEHRLSLLIEKFISEHGHHRVAELVSWLDGQL